MAKKAKKAKKTTKKKGNRTTAVAKRKPTAKRVAATRKTSKPAASARGPVLQSAAVGFTVNDAEKSIAWYRDVLGFKVSERWEYEGKLMGAEMRSGNVTINLGQDDWKMGRDRVKGAGTRTYITTGGDIDRLADQIKARGGSLDHEPKDEWGMRAFAITDPDGFKLTFMTESKKAR